MSYTEKPKIDDSVKISETKTMRTVARVRDYNDTDCIACGLTKDMNDYIEPHIYGNSWIPCRYIGDDLQVYIMNSWQYTPSIDWEFKNVETISTGYPK